MKRPNLANKLLAWLAVLCWTVVCLAGSVPAVSVSPVSVMAASGTVQQPTYMFNNGTIWDDLGVKAYNNYLYQVSQTHSLPEVVVAVLDSGVNADHPVFDERRRLLGEYGRNYYLNDRKQVVYDNTWDQDNSGHGSHVAGLIADATLSNVKILPVKIFQGSEKETITSGVIEEAVKYVVDLKKSKNLNIVAINMSLGTPIMSPNDTDYRYSLIGYQSYINVLRNAGILPIVAAGNDGVSQLTNIKAGRGNEWYSLPSACAGAVAVSAYDTRKTSLNPTGRNLANFSNFGVHIRLSAPGVLIESAWKAGEVDTLRHKENGTSMATPFVTLCYAMLMSDITKTTAEDLGIEWDDSEKANPFYYMTVQYKALLLHAEDLGEPGIDNLYGYGGVNVADFAVPADQVPVKESYDASEVRNPTVTVLSNGSDEHGVFAGLENVFWVAMGVMVAIIVINAVRYRFQRARYQEEGETTDE